MNPEVPMTRDMMRSELLGVHHGPKVKSIKLFGMDVDLVQPSIRHVLNRPASENMDAATSTIRMVIEYACMPDTHTRIFEEADLDTMLEWPWGEDLMEVNAALAELSGIKIKMAEEVIKTDPLSASLPNTLTT